MQPDRGGSPATGQVCFHSTPLHINIYIYIYMCVYINIYIYIYIYIYVWALHYPP